MNMRAKCERGRVEARTGSEQTLVDQSKCGAYEDRMRLVLTGWCDKVLNEQKRKGIYREGRGEQPSTNQKCGTGEQ